MNRHRYTRPLWTIALLALIGAVGAQTYYTRELVRQVAQRDPQDPVATSASAPTTPRLAQRPGTPDASDAGTPTTPWAEMHTRVERMQHDMEQAFRGAFAEIPAQPAFTPTDDGFGGDVDLDERGPDYVVTARIPGAEAGNVQVDLRDRVLRITARTASTQTRGGEDGTARSASRTASVVQRAFTLPGPVDAAGLQSRYDAGVLTVTVPKAHS